MLRRTAFVTVAAVIALGVAFAEEAKPQPKADDAAARMEKGLGQKVEFNLEDASLDAALQLLQKASGVTIVVDPAVKEQAAKTKITLSVKDMPVKNALGLILRLAGLRYIVQDQAILVSTRDRLVSELLAGPAAGEPVEESRPLTVADAVVAAQGPRGLGDDVEDLTDPVAAIHSRPWRLPEREYRDPSTGLMQFPAPPVWIASPYENSPATRFTKDPYFLKPEYLAEFYYGAQVDPTKLARREMVARLVEVLRRNPNWTAKDILKQIETLEAGM